MQPNGNTVGDIMSLSRREKYEKRLSSLKTERATWEKVWRDIGEQMAPYRYRFEKLKRNRGDKLDTKILNNTPTKAIGTGAAGMMAGITSPARKWFSMTTSNPKLADLKPVKEYLDNVQREIERVLQASNWYTTLADGTYPDLLSFGTAAMFLEESEPGRVVFTPLTLGEYCLDTNQYGEVDVCYREIEMIVRNVVRKFGLESCSQSVKNSWSKGDLNQTVHVVHAVQPNDELVEGAIGPKGMAYSSHWWDVADEKKRFLHESGYQEFPVLGPRWSRTPGDTYGRGPGWTARGDCRGLQHKESRLLRMLDKIVDPPMVATINVARPSLLPGDVTYVPKGSEGVYQPAMTIQPGAIEKLESHIARDEKRILEAFFNHLWQSIISDDRNQRPTATEVEARRQEVMLLLGPLLANLDGDLLEPCIERLFNILDRNDLLPLPPEELEDEELKIEFISIMHKMQQSVSLAGIRTFLGEVSALAALRPDVLDKINPDVIVDELARVTGIRADIIMSTDEVDAIRQQKAEQEEAQRNGEAALAASEGIGNLSGAEPQKISELASMLSPVAAAQGGALGSVKES